MGQAVEAVLQHLLEQFLGSIPALETVIISTFDGIGLASASKGHGAQQPVNSPRQDGTVSNVFIFVSEQVSKMGWGQLRKCVSFYEHKTLVHINLNPTVVTFVGDANLNADDFIGGDLYERLEKGLAPLRVGGKIV